MKRMMNAVCIALLGMAVSGWAQGPMGGPDRGMKRPGGGMDRGKMFDRLLQNDEVLGDLGISEEQRSELQSSLAETRKKSIKLKAEHEVAEVELNQLLRSDAPDQDAVMKAVDEVGRTRTALRKVAVAQQLKVKEILGADKVRQLHQRMRERAREHFGERGERGSRGPGAAREGRRGKGQGERGAPQEER